MTTHAVTGESLNNVISSSSWVLRAGGRSAIPCAGGTLGSHSMSTTPSSPNGEEMVHEAFEEEIALSTELAWTEGDCCLDGKSAVTDDNAVSCVSFLALALVIRSTNHSNVVSNRIKLLKLYKGW
uniref:Uncharacterized protein n=1 Tax=Haemonchus contortus TaxID=6289 RepID=A0A7I4YXQ8_HAECO